MCGIIGYTGPLEVKDILMNGLEQLEYRGYDSAGIAMIEEKEQKIQIRKCAGKVSNLRALCAEEKISSHCGIGHTRWATHGGVTDENAHPHCVGRVALIHNGIIENYHELAKRFGLLEKLKSDTDSEVAAAVLDYFYKGDPCEAIKDAVSQFTGSFAFCIMFEDQPGKIFAVRNVSPLVASLGESGAMLASDLTALIPYSKSYFILPEYHILTLSEEGIELKGLNGKRKEPELLEINWTVEAAQKNGYPHFMLKEIFEQPESIRKTILPRIKDGLPDFSDDNVPDDIFRGCNKIYIIACGTAMHAGMVCKTMIEPLMRIPVTVSVASEFRYEDPLVEEQTLVIAVSQSGETIDTLEALRLAKRCHARTLAVVNVKGSTIARECDNVIYTHAGPEIAVASTKAYTVQLAALYLIGCKLGLVNAKYSVKQAKAFITGLLSTAAAVEEILQRSEQVKETVEFIKDARDIFMIGRGLDYTLSLEGALKLKEISYIHAEAYAAGELKHGTIALITEGVPVIAIATQKKVFSKTVSNIREVKARGAFVILLTGEQERMDPDVYDIRIPLPELSEMFMVFPAVTVLQLIAYYTSVAKGVDVDKPRNLAKSVTVE